MAKGLIKVDMNKAKDIYKDMLRSIRKPILEKLDLEFMKAIESGNTALQAEIAGTKQKLRDLTDDPKIDNVKKVEEFKKIFPADMFSSLED